jgi:ferredoxin
VMDTIINAPVTVKIEFVGQDDETPMVPTLPIGTPVDLVYVTEQGKSQTIQAKVGDNLRQTLINNNIEVYQGFGQIMGNCGGAGQCKLCAMDFLESEGWLERSDYEDKKLRKFPNARLSCLNSIQGPAKIQKTKQ